VVIGNPPYNGYAGVAQDEEAGLIEPYKRDLASEWGITKNYLDDPYIRFFRLAERSVAERSGRGVVCFISTFSYIADPTYVQMRRHLLTSFDRIWIDSLNGDSRKTGKTTPDGKPDPSVFSTAQNRQGIRVGTAIATLVCSGAPERQVRQREFWGADKRTDLLESLTAPPEARPYSEVIPSRDSRYSFRPVEISGSYLSWPTVRDISMVEPQLGLNENRGGGLQGPTPEDVVAHVRSFVAGNSSEVARGLYRAAAGYDPEKMRETLRKMTPEQWGSIRPYLARPLDYGFALISDVRGLWNRSRPKLRSWVDESREFLLTRPSAAVRDEGVPTTFSKVLGEQDSMRGHAYFIPFRLPDNRMATEEQVRSGSDANLSAPIRAWLRETEFGGDHAGVWFHALAVLHSPAYLNENAEGLAGGWPRIPLPVGPGVLAASVALGSRVAFLLDPKEPHSGGAPFGTLSATNGVLDPSTDLSITARWGIVGKGGITMPSTGRLTERPYSDDERTAIAEHAVALGMTGEQAIELLGETCFDVYLNDNAYWRCVPSAVWRFRIGGYQVIKKWLSYRERVLLGRDLKPEEARYVTEMVRRIAALVLMQPELDANYERVKADVWEWDNQRPGE